MFFTKKSPPVAAPFCEDCRWYRINAASPTYSKCGNPTLSGHALVVRSGGGDLPYCCNAREFSHQCSKAGKLFEAKPPVMPAPEAPPYRGVLDSIDCSALRIAKSLEELSPAIVKLAAKKK